MLTAVIFSSFFYFFLFGIAVKLNNELPCPETATLTVQNDESFYIVVIFLHFRCSLAQIKMGKFCGF